LIVGGSIGLIILAFFLPGTNPYANYPFGFFSGTVLILIGVAGMVLGPYFALAGFIAKENSVWVEANRMIQQHISLPILGGLGLYLGLLSFLFFPLLTLYIIVVIVGTLIPVMANKTGKPAGHSHETTKK
jgi:hypothetical protein